MEGPKCGTLKINCVFSVQIVDSLYIVLFFLLFVYFQKHIQLQIVSYQTECVVLSIILHMLVLVLILLETIQIWKTERPEGQKARSRFGQADPQDMFDPGMVEDNQSP